MKKRALWHVLPLLLILAAGLAAGPAHAAVFTDYYDAGDTKMGGWFGTGVSSVSWTFDITNDGYDPLSDAPVTSAFIDLNLLDDAYDPWFWKVEFAKLTTNEEFVSVFEVNTGTATFQLQSLTMLSSTGTLDVTLKALAGDFIFRDATLTAYTVPIPAAIWLFGSGLIALIGIRRHK